MYFTIYLPCILPVNNSFHIFHCKKFGISISIKYQCTWLNMGLNNKMYSSEENLYLSFLCIYSMEFYGRINFFIYQLTGEYSILFATEIETSYNSAQ